MDAESPLSVVVYCLHYLGEGGLVNLSNFKKFLRLVSCAPLEHHEIYSFLHEGMEEIAILHLRTKILGEK